MAQRRLVEIVLQGKDQTKQAFEQLGLNLGSSQMKLLAFAGSAAAVGAAVVKAVDALHEQGLQVRMLTGDNERTARTVAHEVGIDPSELQRVMAPIGLDCLVSSTRIGLPLSSNTGSPFSSRSGTSKR